METKAELIAHCMEYGRWFYDQAQFHKQQYLDGCESNLLRYESYSLAARNHYQMARYLRGIED